MKDLEKYLISLIIIAISLTISPKVYPTGIVLCYHKVGYSLEDIYSILPEMMTSQVELINKLGIKIVSIDYFTNEIPSEEKVVSITFDDGRRLPKNIIIFFETNNIPITLFIYPQVVGGNTFFSWKEISNLSERGFTIGSHSFSHPFLKGVSKEKLYQEIVYSKEYIEKKINKEVFAFAYPFGLADKKAYDLVKSTYKIGFLVDDKPIKNSSILPNKLSRFIIFNHTTLGQFREILDKVFEKSNTDYKVYTFESQVNSLRFKLYFFPTEYSETSILIIPSVFVGPSWAKLFIEKLRQFNISSYVFESELYSFPFYKYEIYKDLLVKLDFETISTSLKEVIDYLKNRTKKVNILTWGDGFDLFLHTIGKYEDKSFISKVIVLNPSLSGEINKNQIENNIKLYKNLLEKGKYDFENFRDNVKISTLLHLAFFKPKDTTPFLKEFGRLNNLNTFLKYISKNKHLKIENHKEKIEEYIESLEYSPFYPFSVVEPISYFLGLNQFLLSNFNKKPYNNIKTLVIYNDDYQNSFNLINKWNKNITGIEENISTVDMFLSDKVFEEIFKFIKN
ncbi:MAG: polysaccharide deacetylase family protein [Brevinematia bacterium]